MRIGLVDVDGRNFPNLALMKLSARHKAQGDAVEWWNGFTHYNRVYLPLSLFHRCFEELWQFYVSSRSHAGVNNFERDPRSYFYPLHRISRCGDCYLAFSSDLSGVHVDLSEKEEIVCIQNLCV